MLVIPAIDLKGGRCVRLRQGRADQEEIFSDDPVRIAKTWEELGARLIHLVDLDGAFKGRLQNFFLVKAITQAVKIPVQLGGGLRDSREITRVFKAGIDRVVLGTRAFESPEWVRDLVKKYGRKILIAVDSSQGKLAIRGWRKKTNIKIIDFIKGMKNLGVKEFVFTDVKRDGMMKGPNLEMIKEVLSKLNPVRERSSLMTCGEGGFKPRKTFGLLRGKPPSASSGNNQRSKSVAFSNGVKVKLIASGGITTIEDLRQLKRLERKGLVGVIIGRALYTGAIKLKEAIKIGTG